MKRRDLLIVAAFLAPGALLTGWVAVDGYLADRADRAPVTDAEARRHFGRIVAATETRDFEALRQLNGSVGNCRSDIQRYCPIDYEAFSRPEVVSRRCGHIVPRERPAVVSTRHVPPDDESYGGRILSVRGVDGDGEPHETEVIVFRREGGLAAISAVYWSGTKFPPQSPDGGPDLTRVKPDPVAG